MTVMAFSLPFIVNSQLDFFASSAIFKLCSVDGVEEKNLQYRKWVLLLRVLTRLI